MKVTQERLKQVLDYDPETGVFTWKVRTVNAPSARTDKVWNTRFAGTEPGHMRPDGYRGMTVDRMKFQAHRLAWFYVNGTWPPFDLDHVDGNKANNAIANLRLADRSENMANTGRRASNTSGRKGVYQDRRTGRFIATVHPRGKKIHIGVFDNIEDAGDAYAKAAAKHFGEFARAS